MRIALIGATGFIGSALLAEALARGHSVTALARDVSGLRAHERVTPVALDVLDLTLLIAAIADHDVIVAAYNPEREAGVRGSATILAAAEASGVARLLVVGGAGSLLLEDGRRRVDTDEFAPEWRKSALATASVLDMLRANAAIDWVMLSPAVVIEAGATRGGFRLGHDHVVRDAEGRSFITTADYAAAMLDEAEHPAHHRERFTLAY